MSHTENTLNAIRNMPLPGVPPGTATCFILRALKAYSRQTHRAKPAELAVAIPNENTVHWQWTARFVASRIEAAQVRGQRIDDAFFRELIKQSKDGETTRRFLHRAVRNYSLYIRQLPLGRIERGMRGIGAAHWKRMAQATLDVQDTVAAFDTRH